MTDAKPELKYLPIDLLVPNDWNPNQESEATFLRLVEEIKDVGFIDPCEVVPLDDGRYVIIGGEHRWRAAKEVGLEEIPCVILVGKKWTDEDLQRLVTVRLNVLRGRLNPDKFIALYNEMAEKYGQDALQSLFAYTDSKAFQKLVEGVKKGMKKALPKEMQKDFDEAAKEAKTVDDLAKIIQEMFSRYGNTVPLSFMVFSFGKQDHVYVQINAKTRKALNKVLAYCKATQTDLNDFLAPVIAEAAKRATAALAEDPVKAVEPVSG